MKLLLKTAIQQFLIDQELKGNTKKTLSYYSNNLRYFADFIGHDKPVAEITLANLKQYQLMIKNRPKLENHPFKPTENEPISTTSLQTYIRAVRSFLGWMYKEGYITENLQEKFKLPKAIKKTVEILSDDEIKVLLKCFNENTEMGLRNLCLIALMLDCGLRRNEALYLNYDNVHISQGVIKVTGKGQKERIVPLGLYTKKLLLKYITTYRPQTEYETKRLLIDRYLKPMTENCVKELFLRTRRKTRIDRLHPHMLRHPYVKYTPKNNLGFFRKRQCGEEESGYFNPYNLSIAFLVINHTLPLFR